MCIIFFQKEKYGVSQESRSQENIPITMWVPIKQIISPLWDLVTLSGYEGDTKGSFLCLNAYTLSVGSYGKCFGSLYVL
jgi:hypothetical protein